jgi:hypothetical protein
VLGAHVGDVQHDPEQLELGVERVAGQRRDLHCLFDALQREVLRLGRQDRVIGGDQRVDGQQSERRRAVDEDELPVALEVHQRAAERDLAADLAGQRQLGLRQREVRRDHLAVNGLGGSNLPLKDVSQGRLDVGVGVEVVREVPLRIGVDHERVDIETREDVGEVPHQRRLAGAALLR